MLLNHLRPRPRRRVDVLRTLVVSATLAASALVAAPSLSAQAAPVAGPSAPPMTAAAAAPRPKFQLPFRCGQVWRADTWAPDHAPAMDLTYLPQSGTPGKLVLAAAAGTVKEAGFQSGSGNYVLINHGNKWFTVYIHLRDTPLVHAGQKVSTGTAIGYVGHTGTLSNGVNHLHFEELYNANGDNYLNWGVAGGERVPITLNGAGSAKAVGGVVRAFSRPSTTWHLTSHNACTNPPTPKPPSKYTVTTFANAPGYSSPGSHRTGTLDKGTGYVYCKVQGPTVKHGSSHNKWWLKTDLDTGTPWRNQYVSAYYLAKWGNDQAKDDAGTTIRTC
jgi:hypothetical protein